jgi:hypothetical protein
VLGRESRLQFKIGYFLTEKMKLSKHLRIISELRHAYEEEERASVKTTKKIMCYV